MPKAWKRRLRNRPGKPWVVFWRQGRRRLQETFGADEEEADRFLAEKLLELGQASPVAADRNITIRDFAAKWIADAAPGLKKTTVSAYQQRLDLYILPRLGDQRVRDLHQHDGVRFLSGLLVNKLAENTVRTVYQVLRRMYQRAKFEGIIHTNPMTSLWKEMPVSAQSKRETRTMERDAAKAKALKPSEVTALLSEEVKTGDRLFAVTYLAGLRMGEVLGLQLDDVDIQHAEITVRRRLAVPVKGATTLSDRIDSPKGGRSRVVDMSPGLVAILAPLVAERRKELLQAPGVPWLFTERGTTRSYFVAYQQFRRLLKRADLPMRYTPHGLRHSYATHMLQRGVELAYVATQLGDRVETLLAWYWWAMPVGNKSRAAVIDETGATVGANASLTGTERAE